MHGGEDVRTRGVFPPGFLWGAATAAAQIEGGWDEGGRGPSIWDRFCREPGRVLGGDSPARACGHFHRWREDIALMGEIGLQAYRFSVSWSRCLPDGCGTVNAAGLDYYEALVDGLLGAGIRPFLTLYHWDLPEALQQRGGWLRRDAADWFADYAGVVAARLGDRVKDWITFNEPQIFLGFGLSNGTHAPGLVLPHDEVFRAAHHVNLAHGKAALRLRATVDGVRLGMAIATKIGIPEEPGDERCVEAARRYTIDPEWSDDFRVFLNNVWWCDPVLRGRYPELLAERLPAFFGIVEAGDMEVLHQPADFFGFNYYFGSRIAAPADGRAWRVVEEPAGAPRTMFGWPVHPDGMYWAAKFFHERYGLPLYVFENGLSSMDWVALDGAVHDTQRIDFLTRYLRALHRAHADGLPVAGYFHWSLLDNFEWAQGYRERFGLIHVDYATQARVLKDSARWYREVIAGNGAVLWR